MSRLQIGSILSVFLLLTPVYGHAQTHRAISKDGEYFDACDPTCSQPATVRSVNQGASGGALLSYSKSWPGLDADSGYNENFQSFHWLAPETWTQRLYIRNNGTNNNGSNRVRFEPLVVSASERAAAFAAMMNIDGSENFFGGGGVGNGDGTIRQAYFATMTRLGSMNIQWNFFPLSIRQVEGVYKVGNQPSAITTVEISPNDGHSIVFDSKVLDMAITNADSGGQVGPGLYLAQVVNTNGTLGNRAWNELKKIVIPQELIGCTDDNTYSRISYGAATVLNTYDPNQSDITKKDLAQVAFTAACLSGDRTRHVLLYNELTGQVSRVTPSEDCLASDTSCDSDMPKFSSDGTKLYYATKFLDPSLNDMGLGNLPPRGTFRIVEAIRSGDQFVPTRVISNLARNTAGPAPEALCPVEYKGALSMVVKSQLAIVENSNSIVDRAQTNNDYDDADVVVVKTASTNALSQVPLVVSSVNSQPRTIANQGSGLRRDAGGVPNERCQLSMGAGITVTYSTAATNLVSTNGQDARFTRGQVIQTMLPWCSTTMVRGRYVCSAGPVIEF